MKDKKGYTYILTNLNNKVMYIGVTSDLVRRIQEHVEGKYYGFTTKYNVHKLVYYEVYADIVDAIKRETQLKNWKRKWKDTLIAKCNPSWNDFFPMLDGKNPTDNILEQ